MNKKPIISHHVASAGARLRHVFVRDLDLVASIGIYDTEKVKPQRIVVNIDLSVDEGEGPNDDEIGHVVSYEIVVKKVESILRKDISIWSRRCARKLPPPVSRTSASWPRESGSRSPTSSPMREASAWRSSGRGDLGPLPVRERGALICVSATFSLKVAVAPPGILSRRHERLRPCTVRSRDHP